MGKICTFFGHRDARPDLYMLKEQIRRLIEDRDVTTFWCGGYGAFDRAAAKTVWELQREYQYIRLILVLAYPPRSRNGIDPIYDGFLYPEFLKDTPQKLCIIRRNEWIAENCDIAVCFIDHPSGGAYYGYRTARENGKVIYNLGLLPRG